MTKIYANSNLVNSSFIDGIKSINFYHTGTKVYSAISQTQIWGSFLSNQIYAPEGFLRWDELQMGSNYLENVWVYIRSADENIQLSKWTGPYKITTNDISNLTGQLIQFLIILKSTEDQNTQINNFKIKYISSQDSKIFYSKCFNLGFNPESIFLTYNATTTDDSILKFFIAGKDTIDELDYQEIPPNTLTKLDGISQYSEKIKLMVQLAGDSSVPIELHEIGFMFSGNKNIKLNKIEESSSSEDDSSSSSSMQSSSSSSIDSSSSSSDSSSSSSS